jgi:hypothetical protein
MSRGISSSARASGVVEGSRRDHQARVQQIADRVIGLMQGLHVAGFSHEKISDAATRYLWHLAGEDGADRDATLTDVRPILRRKAELWF